MRHTKNPQFATMHEQHNWNLYNNNVCAPPQSNCSVGGELIFFRCCPDGTIIIILGEAAKKGQRQKTNMDQQSG